MLDLIFTNADYMIENLKYIAPLGKSDHVGLVWTFITYSTIDTRIYGGKRYDYWKANMAVMNAAFHNVKWAEEMDTKGVNVRWKYFKLKIEEEIYNMPLRERKKPNPKAPWKTKRVFRSVKKQIQLWKR